MLGSISDEQVPTQATNRRLTHARPALLSPDLPPSLPPSLSFSSPPQGFAGELDVDAELDRLDGGAGGSGGRRQQQQQQRRQPGERFTPRDKSKHRAKRDAKFGFGGPKRRGKQNDAASAAAVDGYKPGRFDDGVGRKVARKAGGGGGGKFGGGGGRGGWLGWRGLAGWDSSWLGWLRGLRASWEG